MPEIEFFADHRCSLGESPLWDPRSSSVWWIDAREQRICSADLDGNLRVEWRYSQWVGSIGLCEKGLIASLADGFYLIDAATGDASLLARLPHPDSTTRLNDGKADRAGRFLCGETQLQDDAAGSLWSVDGMGNLRMIADDMRISNAICFSPEGDTLYFADSLDGFIRCHAYDNLTGEVGAQTGTIDVRKFGQAPDGATVDADGNLWIAIVLDQAVVCVSPDGAVLQRIEVPIPFPSCPAFAGPNMDILILTSIKDSGFKLVTDDPDAGRILSVRGTGARGIAETPFRLPHQ